MGPVRVSAGTRGRRRSSSSNGGGAAAIFGLLVVIALVIKFWAWILAAAVLWVIVKVALKANQERQKKNQEIASQNAAMAARADYEHNALMDGDTETGIYGQFPPPEDLK
jgi:type II secretory pathway pseudopilin PulG